MSESLADDGHRDAGGEHEAGLSVAQVVESNGAQPAGVGEFAEALGDGLGVQRCPVFLGEDVAAVDPGAPPLVALLLLAKLMAEQCTDGGFVEVDDAVLAAGGLYRCLVCGQLWEDRYPSQMGFFKV